MTVVVHKFLMAVRFIQKSWRGYHASKIAKVAALTKIWNRAEKSFIRKKLRKRKAQARAGLINAKKAAAATTDIARLNNVIYFQLREQSDAWSKLDRKMERMVGELRETGVIVDEHEEETIRKLQAPSKMRDSMLFDVVQDAVSSVNNFSMIYLNNFAI